MIDINKNESLIIWITAICVTIAQLTAYIYIPSLPAIAQQLSIDAGDVQASVAVFFISFGLSGLIYGPASDYYGRKPMFLIAGVIILIGNIGMIFAHDLTQIMWARFIQGLGAGGVPIFARTVMRDCFSGKHLNRAISLFSASVTMTPALAPLFGALFQYYFGWRSAFIFLVFYSSMIILFAWFILPETNKNCRDPSVRVQTILQDFSLIIRNVKFLRCSICALLGYSCSVLYLIITPFVFQQQLGISVRVYGALMALPILGALLGNLISARLNYHWSVPRIMYLGTSIIIISALLLVANLFLQVHNLALILVPIIIAMIGAAIVFCNGLAGALKPFPGKAGRAAALLSVIQIAGSGIVSAGISHFDITHLSGLGFGLLGCGLTLLFSYSILLKWENMNTRVSA